MGSGSLSGRLVSVAPELFGERGYLATSVQDLADVAGCSKSTFYRHFPEKHELLEAASTPLVSAVGAILTSVSLDLDADEDRVSVIQAYIGALSTHRAVAKVLLTDAGARSTPIGQRMVVEQRSLVARLTGPRASLRTQVRARCALAISHLMVGELSKVPVHRLRSPLLEAAIEMLGQTGGASSLGAEAATSQATLAVSDP